MTRRLVALGVGVVLLVLIVLGIHGCLQSRKRNALKSYNRDVGALVHESTSQVARPLFSALANAKGKSPLDVETSINELHVTAQEQAKRAKGLNVPGEMSGAQRYLSLVLDFRAEAIDKIAGNVRTAFVPGGRRAGDAINGITGEMQVFLASDVVYAQRVSPLIKQVLGDNKIANQAIVASRFLPDLGWIDPATVRGRLGAPGGGGARPRGPVAPGTHGHSLDGVSVGSTSLQTGSSNRIAGASNPTFTVKLSNGGSNDETQVKVDVTITGGGKSLSASKTIDKTKAGASASVDIPLGAAVPTGVSLKVVAFVEPVPGEKNVANNKQTFTAVFTR